MRARSDHRWMTVLIVVGIASLVGLATAVLTGNPRNWLTGAVVSVACLTTLIGIRRRQT